MKKLLIPFFCLALSSTAMAQKNNTVAAIDAPVSALNETQQKAQKIIDNYTKALGGKEKLSTIKTLLQEGTMSIMGQELETVIKKMGNKLRSEQKMMGQTVATVIFDGTKGQIEQMGQKMDMPAAQVEMLKKSNIVDALSMNATKVTAVGEEKLENKDYDVITIDGAKMYFDKATGLLYKANKDSGVATIISYATVDGMKFPSEMVTEAQGMKMEMNLTNVLVNSGVTEDDFKL